MKKSLLLLMVLFFSMNLFGSSYSAISESSPFGMVAVWFEWDPPFFLLNFRPLSILRTNYIKQINKLVDCGLSWDRANCLPGGKDNDSYGYTGNLVCRNGDTLLLEKLNQIDSCYLFCLENNINLLGGTGMTGKWKFNTNDSFSDSAVIYDMCYTMTEIYDGDGLGHTTIRGQYLEERTVVVNGIVQPVIIEYLELCNEPDENLRWWPGCDFNDNDTFCEFEDFIKYIQISSKAVHDANPNAKVIAPSFLDPKPCKWDITTNYPATTGSIYYPDTNYIWKVFIDSCADYIDIISTHYIRNGSVSNFNDNDSFYVFIEELHNILESKGYSNYPIWNTEHTWQLDWYNPPYSNSAYDTVASRYKEYMDSMLVRPWFERTFFFYLRGELKHSLLDTNIIGTPLLTYDTLKTYIHRNTPKVTLYFPEDYDVPPAPTILYSGNSCNINYGNICDTSFDTNITSVADIAIKIEYTIDGGNNWLVIADSIEGDSGICYYNWEVPNVSSELCVVRVIAKDLHGLEGTSTGDGYFTIRMSDYPTWVTPYPLSWDLQNEWSSRDQCDYIMENSNGLFIAGCQTQDEETGSYVGGILVLNDSASIIKTKIFQSNQLHRIRCILEREDGDGYIITGTDSSLGIGGVLRVVDTNFNVISGVRIGTGEVQSVIWTSDSNYLAVGSYNGKLWMGKFILREDYISWVWRSSDLEMWGNIPGYLYSVVESNGKYVAVGSSRNAKEPGTLFLKVNSDGSGLYTKTYPFGNISCWASAYRIVEEDGNKYVFVGQEKRPDTLNGQGATTFRVDSLGNIIWKVRYEKYSEPYFHSMNSVFINESGNIIVAGTGSDQRLSEELGFIAHLDISNGEYSNITSPFGGLYQGDWNRSGMGKMNQTSDGGYIVGGRIYYNGNPWKMNTAISRFSYDGDEMLADAISDGISNPFAYSIMCANSLFRDKSTIRFVLPRQCNVNIVVYNILGQRVRTLVNEEREPGAYEIFWDGTDNRGISVSSGSYFLRFQAGDFLSTKSLTVIR